jgi:hypothetical protein
MEGLFSVLVPIALGAVALVLLLGLWNMLRGGSPNLSQTLMRWRVILQFVAIIMIMAAIYFAAAPGHGPGDHAAEPEAPAATDTLEDQPEPDAAQD